MKILWACGLDPQYEQNKNIGRQVLQKGVENVIDSFEQADDFEEVKMFRRIARADLVIADFTPEKDQGECQGIPCEPIVVATLSRFRFLKPTYILSDNLRNVPADWIGAPGIGGMLIYGINASLELLLLSYIDLNSHQMVRPWIPLCISKKRMFLAMPFASLGSNNKPSAFIELFKCIHRKGRIKGMPVLIGKRFKKNRNIILGTMNFIASSQYFIGDFSTYNLPGSSWVKYPNANVVTETVLAKWVFKKEVTLIYHEKQPPDYFGWPEHLPLCLTGEILRYRTTPNISIITIFNDVTNPIKILFISSNFRQLLAYISINGRYWKPKIRNIIVGFILFILIRHFAISYYEIDRTFPAYRHPNLIGILGSFVIGLLVLKVFVHKK